jgi:hypothetical protein
MRSKNEVLCAAAGRLAAERSEADKPAKAHKTIFAPDNILFFLQIFITNYLRHVKKPGARCTIFKNLQVTKYKLQVISY